MDLKGREKWVRKELVDRIAGMYNGVSLLMGGTLDSTVARTFGSYVFEIHVPKECRIPVRPAGDGEMEVFIPFGIAPEWIKKVVDSRTGNVIFERP